MVTRSWLWAILIVVASALVQPSTSLQPQINLLNKGCSQYHAPNARDFFNNLNATFQDLTRQLSGGKRFATSQQSRSSSPVYAMVQCRNYLSKSDCLSCYGAAVGLIRNCSTANGARVIFDGCFLRYESDNFYDQSTLPGNAQICSNRTASASAAFDTGAQTVLKNLELATPKISGYFAATTQSSAGGDIVYAIAQCAETVTQSGCQDCLTVAYKNIQGCLPNDEGRAVDAACFMRYSDTAFFPSNQTVNIAPFLRGSSSKKKAIIGGVVGGICLVLLVIALVFWSLAMRRRRRAPRDNILGATQLQGPNIFGYKDLKTATKNFSKDTKLGSGGFGDVYKGTLKNGHTVAVKKLDINFNRAKADFETEVRLISNVHHRNLVRLLGCCNKGGELLLIYEYMANGSLDRYLFGDRKGALSWKQRYDIIYGTARGLAYLHEGYHVCIIHRDIKPSNILLDDDFQPKIADFGLARLLPGSQTHVTTNFAGTLGYTAPEYAVHGHLSEKVDIYSLGIVILEIISGRRSNYTKDTSDSDYLLEDAWKFHESGMHEKLADESMDPEEYKVQDLKKMIEIALVCTQSPPSSRPTVSEILYMLLSDHSTEQITTPSRPSFISSDLMRSNVSTSVSSGSAPSNATASFSQYSGR